MDEFYNEEEKKLKNGDAAIESEEVDNAVYRASARFLEWLRKHRKGVALGTAGAAGLAAGIGYGTKEVAAIYETIDFAMQQEGLDISSYQATVETLKTQYNNTSIKKMLKENLEMMESMNAERTDGCLTFGPEVMSIINEIITDCENEKIDTRLIDEISALGAEIREQYTDPITGSVSSNRGCNAEIGYTPNGIACSVSVAYNGAEVITTHEYGARISEKLEKLENSADSDGKKIIKVLEFVEKNPYLFEIEGDKSEEKLSEESPLSKDDDYDR